MLHFYRWEKRVVDQHFKTTTVSFETKMEDIQQNLAQSEGKNQYCSKTLKFKSHLPLE